MSTLTQFGELISEAYCYNGLVHNTIILLVPTGLGHSPSWISDYDPHLHCAVHCTTQTVHLAAVSRGHSLCNHYIYMYLI